MAEYIWVVQGDASRVPVYARTRKYEIYNWLVTRRGNRMLRLFRLGGPKNIEVCIPCFLDNPKKPVRERKDHVD